MGHAMETKYSIQELLRRMDANWPEAATPENAVVLSLIRMSDLGLEKSRSKLAPLGLTQAGFEVLVTLRSLAPPRQLTPTELHKSILITSGGMTKVLRHLQDQGYITRQENPDDGRSMFVCLTEAGRVFAETSMAEVAKGDCEVLNAAFTSDEMQKLQDLLLTGLSRIEA